MFDALTLHRLAHALHRAGFGRSANLVCAAGRVLFSAHLPPEAKIGEGTEVSYGGIGVIVHREAVIGRNVMFAPGVVVGGRSELPGAPVIEDEVKIGAGAKILGPIRIGAGARVGANAVVIHDVAPGETVAGIPARPIRSKKRSAA
jgi:serine O-acetyltransferase